MLKRAAKPENAQPAAKRKLTQAERKQIEAIIRQAKGDGKPHTVQDSIPFRNLYPDGLCRLDDRLFSKTIAYEDVNYRLAGPDDQRDIFERLCDFYNGYDPSIGVQMTLSSRHEDKNGNLFGMDAQGDALDDMRVEASGILQMQYERGNNGFVKRKYVTLTIEAENLPAARARFSRIEADTLNRFKVMGAGARVLDGKERLALLHGLLHPEGGKFAFEWDWLPASGLSVKDFIAPSSFEFGETRRFRIGEMYGAVSFLQILAPEIQDRILTDFMDVEGNLLVTMHVRGINQNEAIKMVKRKITDLDAMKIQEQKKAARSGYDLDILPSDLSTYGGAAKNLLQDLQSRNERMFNMTFLMLHLAPTKQKLEIAVSQSASVAQTHNCILTRLDFQQEDGLMSSLPLGLNRIKIERSLTTSALAVFVPFVTQELFMGGGAMYYGLNALSNNMILLDRKQSRCPNGLVFGTPGSGKSMSCKREITYVMLTTKDNVIICDPEDEYSPLVNRLGGQVIRLSPNSCDYVNPLDINLNYSEEENPLALKSDFVLSFCELIMGSKTGLEAIEKTVIDRAVQMIYQPYFADPRPENMPVLGDLLDALMAQGIPEAERVAQALDLYVNGSLNFFNHRTTVDIRNRLVCFDIKGLGKNLKKPGMLIVQDAVWNTVTVNRSIGRATWYFVDEFHLLLKEEQTAAYSAEVWKRFRKWGGVPTGATQNPKDLLSSPEIENILENSDFMEDELREYLDTYEQTHDYDEYHFDLDEIKHDPYVLLSILSALHEGQFTIDQVQDDLQMLFDKQYILTETVTTETRYRTETRTDSEGNEYEVDVPYTYYICTVELENFDLSHVPVYIMDTETLSMYAVYMSALGNRSDLFPSSGYVDKYITNPPEDYEIPAEYLSDERFAALISEAEKYLGYPYVWGGSSPSTSFDCSGFVSYVLTNSGLCNTGRLGAQGLYNISTRVSDPQPGDLVFFIGTYDTAGISHVGFYVGLDEAGNPMFLHCGDPIQYARLNTSYWQQHFYAYGRPLYD